MDAPAPPQPDARRRTIRRRILLALTAAACLILTGLPLALNLWLASPHGCRWVAARIQSRTALEARVAGTSLTPWSGLSIRGIELLQPAPLRAGVADPLLRIERLDLAPMWKRWIRGRFEIESLTVKSPRLVIPAELLADIARRQKGPPVAAAPAAATPPAVAAPAPVPGPSVAIAEDPPATPAPSAPPAPPAPQMAAVPQPTSWLHVENASIALVSASNGIRLLEASDVSGSIPVAGGPAASTLKTGVLAVAGHPVWEESITSVDWKPPFLRFDTPDARLLGMSARWSATAALVSGLPLRVEAVLKDQAFELSGLPHGMQARATSLDAGLLFRGLLVQPTTWQGDFAVTLASPSGSVAGHQAAFDRGSCAVVLRGGMLSCPDARLIGDPLSLLGNGTLLADGRLAAVLRLVAPPEVAEAIARRAFPQLERASLTPLSSPQRAAFDLEARGGIGQILLRPGRDGPILQLQR